MPASVYFATSRTIIIVILWIRNCAHSVTNSSTEGVLVSSRVPDPDHCTNELLTLFGPFKINRCGKESKSRTTLYVLIFFGEAFRAPNGRQNYRGISTDSWIQSQALKSLRAHVVSSWGYHGLQLTRIIAHTYTNPLNTRLLELLEETFVVPVHYAVVRNDTGWRAATLYPGVQLLNPGEHALLLRYDLFFFEDLPPPCLRHITLPHCGEVRVELKSHVADAFAWVPSSRTHIVREYLFTHHDWSHNIAEWLKPFSLFYPAHMNVNPRDHKLGQNLRGLSRPYDLMGRTQRATPMRNVTLNTTL